MSDRIRKIVGDEVYKTLTTTLKEKNIDIKDVDVVKDNFVPKTRFDEVNLKNKNYETEISTLKDQSKTTKELLKNTNVDNVGDLVKSYTKLETTHKSELENIKTNSQSELTKLQKSYLVKDALRENGVTKSKNVDLLYKSIDLENIKLDDKNNLIGMTDVVKSLKTDYKELFTEKITNGTPPKNTNTPPNTNGGSGGNDKTDTGIFSQFLNESGL